MKIGTTIAVIASVFGIAACGSGGYDLNYDCDQALACCEELGSIECGTHNQCVANSESAVENMSTNEQRRADDAFNACSHLESCDYASCIFRELN